MKHMAQERFPRYDEQVAAGEAGQAYAYEQPELIRRLPQEEILTDCQDSLLYLATKRVLDIVMSVAALVVLSPLMLVVAAIIYIDDPHGNPIFVQERVGKNGKPFRFLKFRSMVVNAEALLKELEHKNEMDGPVFKIKDDPRVTKFGKWIRKTSIDELPQLINIIKGEMSIVGPRPPLPREVEKYGPYERQRLLVKPGLTCYWQARGRNEIGFDEWMELDAKYVHHHNLWIDIRLVLLTIRAVLTGRGAM
jgi:lipopolysaccharide/colanic/teichoic acid biosynthesis glycosyltransferase